MIPPEEVDIRDTLEYIKNMYRERKQRRFWPHGIWRDNGALPTLEILEDQVFPCLVEQGVLTHALDIYCPHGHHAFTMNSKEWENWGEGEDEEESLECFECGEDHDKEDFYTSEDWVISPEFEASLSPRRDKGTLIHRSE